MADHLPESDSSAESHSPAEPETESESGDSASLYIDASADELYGIVSDVTRMGELSPECTGGKWTGRSTGPEVGATFRGTNRRGWAWWFTNNKVVAADPGKEFTFQTRESGAQWSYTFEEQGDGTLVTESRSMYRERPATARYFTKLLGGTEVHDQEMVDGLMATLERLKAVAESEA